MRPVYPLNASETAVTIGSEEQNAVKKTIGVIMKELLWQILSAEAEC